MTFLEACARFPCVDLSGISRRKAEEEVWLYDGPPHFRYITVVTATETAGVKQWQIFDSLPVPR